MEEEPVRVSGSAGVRDGVDRCSHESPVASLPSGEVAVKGDVMGILGTYAARSAIVGAGLWLSGDRKNLMRNTLISTAMIQATVLLWAKDQEV